MTSRDYTTLVNSYYESAAPVNFLQSFFTSPINGIQVGEKIEMDIVRFDEEIAGARNSNRGEGGYNYNENTQATKKTYNTALFKEKITLTSFNTKDVLPGTTVYDKPKAMGILQDRILNVLPQIESMIRRSMELMAAQIFQTGTINLPDYSGAAGGFVEDFKPKATHFPTVSTAWNAVGADPLEDIVSAAELNKADGKAISDMLIMGRSAYREFLRNSEVQTLLNNRRIDIGNIRPQLRTNQGTYQGSIGWQDYKFDIFTYPETYIDLGTRARTKFIADESCIVMPREARRDIYFGSIPNLAKELGVTVQSLPIIRRLSSQLSSMDMHLNAWFSANGEELNLGVGSRPIMIPVAIDSWSCIDTNADA